MHPKCNGNAIVLAPYTERRFLEGILEKKIHTALESMDIKMQKEAAEMTLSLFSGDRETSYEVLANNIRIVLQGTDREAQKQAVDLIRHISRYDRLDFIKMAFAIADVDVQREAVKMIWCVSPTERAAFLRMALQDSSVSVQKQAACMIQVVPPSKRDALVIKAMSLLGNAFVESSLYEEYATEEEFLRKPFVKGGSETTLLGGSLKNKVITRHITPETFLAWQSAYEDAGAWREYGFDYVPIEPIIGYRLEKNDTVAVFSGVLDMNLETWRMTSSLFQDDLERARENILAVLAKKNIQHGHPHKGNFCLRFWRDDRGLPDMSRVPRLYLIDFDRALLIEKSQS